MLEQSLSALKWKNGFSVPLSKRRAKFTFSKIHCAEELGDLPGPDECIFLVVDKKWAMADLVPVCYDQAGTIENLTIFTLGWSKQTLGEIIESKTKGLVENVRVICSTYFAKTEKAAYADSIIALEKAQIPCAQVRSHMKVLVACLADGRRVTFMGSANLRSCSALENLTGTGHPAVAELMLAYADKIFQTPDLFI